MIDLLSDIESISSEDNQPEKSYIQKLEEQLIAIIEYTEKLERENMELKNKLSFYENAHTPSSVQTMQKSQKKVQKEDKIKNKKRGAPKGHKGATRKRLEPDEIVLVTTKTCPDCGKDPGESYDKETKIIEELPLPQKIKVTQFELNKYKCQHCGLGFTSKHKDCPKEGKFGPNLLTYVTMLKFHLRGVIRKIQDSLSQYHNFDISTKGIHDILLRVGKQCKNEYERTKAKLQNANWVHIDETGMHVNGDKWWLWQFRSDQNDSIITIKPSRGRKVVKEILGNEWNKPIVVDGWSAYSSFDKVQRCWAHLLREVDEFKKKSKNGTNLNEDIHRNFKRLRVFIDSNPSMDNRISQKDEFDCAMEQLVCKYNDKKELHKPITYIRNGLGKWYTCLLYPGMEPTNNLGEQAIRESVIVRKIIGTFRSKQGSENYQQIASMLMTWKFKGLNMFDELEKLIRQELCLS